MTEKALLFGVLAAGSAFKLGALSWLGQKRRREEFVYVGKVSALYLYPVKSCKSVSIDTAECTETGLCVSGVTDRHWVVVDSKGSFITQRQDPSMALIQTRIVGKDVELSAPGMTSVVLTAEDHKAAGNCRVWTDHFIAMDCGDKAAAFISKYLNREGCRLMTYLPGVTKRNVLQKTSSGSTYALDKDKANFGDFCSYFLVSEASLADLNTRLDKQVTIHTFRPNIVVTGCPAFAEDQWMEVRIGEKAAFRYLDACSRCNLTTVDPFRGVKDPNQQPLVTLRSYRLDPKYGNSPLFGTYLGVEELGPVKVGDPVYAIRWPDKK